MTKSRLGERRRTDIEFLRVLSCLGIVYFHSGVLSGLANNLAYSGLTFFILVSLFFVNTRRNVFENLTNTIRKVFPAFACWSVIYIVLAIVIADKDPGEFVKPLTLMIGGSIHLWYLPFIIFAIPLTVFFGRSMSRRWLFGLMFSLYVVWMATSLTWREMASDFPLPAPQYLHAIGAVFLALWLSGGEGRVRYLAIFISLCLGAYVAYAGQPGVGVVYFLTTLYGLIVIQKSDLIRSERLIALIAQRLSPLTFGIYLVHPLLLSVASRVGFADSIFMPLSVFVGSAIAIQLYLMCTPSFMHKLVRV